MILIVVIVVLPLLKFGSTAGWRDVYDNHSRIQMTKKHSSNPIYHSYRTLISNQNQITTSQVHNKNAA